MLQHSTGLGFKHAAPLFQSPSLLGGYPRLGAVVQLVVSVNQSISQTFNDVEG